MSLSKKIFKILAFFALSFSAVSASAMKSGFAQAFGEIFILDARHALEMYIGRWDGSQKLFFNGQELGEGSFEQTCIARGDDANMRVVSTGKIEYGAQSAIARSVMYIDKEGQLRVDVIGENGDSETYYGRIDKNVVTWIAKHLIFNLDVQTDSFFVSDKGTTMISEGFRYIDAQGKKGILATATILKKISGTFDANQLSPVNSAAFGK